MRDALAAPWCSLRSWTEFLAIAVALVVIAVLVFVRGVQELVLAPAGEPFAVTITRAVNSALFIVVVLEPVRTMTELGGNAAVLALSVALVLVRRLARLDRTWPGAAPLLLARGM